MYVEINGRVRMDLCVWAVVGYILTGCMYACGNVHGSLARRGLLSLSSPPSN